MKHREKNPKLTFFSSQYSVYLLFAALSTRSCKNRPTCLYFSKYKRGLYFMKLPLLYYGNPLLRKKAEAVTEITDEIRQFIKDLEETMNDKSGLGIAAPQAGRSLAICILRPPIED